MLKQLNDFYQKHLGWNKTVRIVLVAVFLIMFLDGDSNLWVRREYDKKIVDLENEILFYKKKIETDKLKLENIHTQKDGLERFAREEYFMKKENEDIFIVVD